MRNTALLTSSPDGRPVGTEARTADGNVVGSAAEARSTRGRKRAGRSPLHPTPANDRLIYVGFLPPNTHCQERNPTMCDSSALARHFLGLVRIVRFLFIAASALIGASAVYVLYILIRRRVLAYRSSLRNVPGPGGANWFKGNFTAVQETDSTRLQEEWVRKYGHVIKFQSPLWVRSPPPPPFPLYSR